MCALCQVQYHAGDAQQGHFCDKRPVHDVQQCDLYRSVGDPAAPAGRCRRIYDARSHAAVGACGKQLRSVEDPVCAGVLPAGADHQRQAGLVSGTAQECPAQCDDFRDEYLCHRGSAVWSAAALHFLFQREAPAALSAVHSDRGGHHDGVCPADGQPVLLVRALGAVCQPYGGQHDQLFHLPGRYLQGSRAVSALQCDPGGHDDLPPGVHHDRV